MLRGTRFTARGFGGFGSTADHFYLMKTASMVEHYTAMLHHLERPRVVELGIFQGGSTAFLAHHLQPEVLLAVDLREHRLTALDEFIAQHGYGSSVKTHYGVDQADSARIGSLIDQELAGEPPDLVIDDASHDLELTRRSFELLFPRLRPGGLYVVEDWGWGLFPFAADATKPSLSILIYELLLMMPYDLGTITDISLTANTATIRRGPTELGPAFRVRDAYGRLGRELIERLVTE